MKRKVVSLLLVAAMLTGMAAGCGSDAANSTNVSGDNAGAENGADAETNNQESEDAETPEQGKVVNIYCWNDEFKSRYEAYASDLAEKHGVEVNFVIVANENNAYQNNLDQALMDQESAAADDKVDVFLIEADYASKYTKSGYALDVVKDVGLTEEDLAQQYQYTKDIVSVDGAQMGTTWQATPGLFAYRRSIAKEVLGTDDPAEVQNYLSDWDKFDETAQKMQEYGYYMLSGYDDSFRAFSNNVSTPWVTDGKINIDDQINKWVDQTMEYTENGYNNKTTLWDLMEKFSVSFILHGASILHYLAILWQIRKENRRLEMVFTVIMLAVKDRFRITGEAPGYVRHRGRTTFRLSRI